MNIEWTIMGKPVLLSKLQDLCYGITVYRCRALIDSVHFQHFNPFFFFIFMGKSSI